MSFAGGRRIVFSSLVVLLIISLLHIWLCCDCQAGAMRIFPGNGVGEEKERHQMKARKSNEDLFRKFFNGRAFGFNRTAKGFDESKRTVPSCPDPLHNNFKNGDEEKEISGSNAMRERDSCLNSTASIHSRTQFLEEMKNAGKLVNLFESSINQY